MKGYFPWRLFFKFLGSFVFISYLGFLLTVIFLTQVMMIPLDFTTFLLSSLFFGMVVVGTGALQAYRLASPIRRFVLKGLRLLSKSRRPIEDLDEDLEEGDLGEYFELEMVLDKIRKKLKKRRLQLVKERQESQALISSLEEAIMSVDAQMHIQFYNSRFANQFLAKPDYEKLCRGELIPVAQILRTPEIQEMFNKTLSDGRPTSLRVQLFSIIDNQSKHYGVKVSPLRYEEHGQISGAMAVFHDVTEQKMAEQIRVEFAENASHELRTPLTSIKGFVDAAKADQAVGRYEQMEFFLKTISKSVDRLVELVNDMLTLSSLDSGKGISKAEIDPEKVTHGVVERLALMASEKRLMIQVMTESGFFWADEKKVEQVIENLLSNAIKYTFEGTQIVIRWVETKDAVEFQIKDEGPGIAEEHQARLFERFYRIDRGRTRDVGGTGLGLSIVKHIVQSHGGKVALKSQLGQGALFICSFPKT